MLMQLDRRLQRLAPLSGAGRLRALLRKPKGSTPGLYTVAVLAVFHGLLGFVALNLTAWAALTIFPSDPITVTYGHRRFELVYPGRSREEVRQLLRETWNRPISWEPFTESRERRFQGRFVNVHASGFRLSRRQGPWPPDPDRESVFVFGGSTTFGYGVADDETIVSELQGFLDKRLGLGRAACYNFGRGSYYSSGERIIFQELLTNGTVPNVAVFIDGLNEFALGAPYPAETLRRSVNTPVAGALRTLARELPLAQIVAQRKAFRPARSSDEALAAVYDNRALLDARLDRYFANRRLIEVVATAWGVHPLFVWQPVPTYHYDLRYHLFGDLDFEKNNYSGFGYARMADRVRREPPGPDFLWAADLQDGVRQPLYVDQIHYTAAMSAHIGLVVGQALLERGLLRSAR
jgi:hypothetical protein